MYNILHYVAMFFFLGFALKRSRTFIAVGKLINLKNCVQQMNLTRYFITIRGSETIAIAVFFTSAQGALHMS